MYKLRAIAILILLTLLFGNTLSSKAASDPSCTPLLSDLSGYLAADPANNIDIIHMTNYQAHGQWWGGFTFATLNRAPNGHFVGHADRLLSNRTIDTSKPGDIFRSSNPFSIAQPDKITYDINPQEGTLIFDGIYGPFKLRCLDGKFAYFGGDSVETFSFNKSRSAIAR